MKRYKLPITSQQYNLLDKLPLEKRVVQVGETLCNVILLTENHIIAEERSPFTVIGRFREERDSNFKDHQEWLNDSD